MVKNIRKKRRHTIKNEIGGKRGAKAAGAKLRNAIG